MEKRERVRNDIDQRFVLIIKVKYQRDVENYNRKVGRDHQGI